MIELTALGSGRVSIDDHGITRERLLRGTRTLAWDQIEAYHLTIEAGVESDLLSNLNPMNFLLGGSYGGRAIWQYGIVLVGGETHIEFDWSFEAATRVIAHVLRTIHDRMMSITRARLRDTGLLSAGDLRIAATEVQWRSDAPLRLEDVESIEFFNSSPVRMRVMKYEKVLPYAHCEMSDVANIIEVLEVAREIGYPVRGIELLDELRASML